MAGQDPTRESTAGVSATFSAFVLLLSLVMGYVICYYWLAVEVLYTAPPVNGEIRYYGTGLEGAIFRPAALVESTVTGRDITTRPSSQPTSADTAAISAGSYGASTAGLALSRAAEGHREAHCNEMTPYTTTGYNLALAEGGEIDPR